MSSPHFGFNIWILTSYCTEFRNRLTSCIFQKPLDFLAKHFPTVSNLLILRTLERYFKLQNWRDSRDFRVIELANASANYYFITSARILSRALQSSDQISDCISKRGVVNQNLMTRQKFLDLQILQSREKLTSALGAIRIPRDSNSNFPSSFNIPATGFTLKTWKLHSVWHVTIININLPRIWRVGFTQVAI